MTHALWLLFSGIWVFAILAGFFLKATVRPGDDFGAVVPGVLCACLAILCLLAWMVLLAIQKWPWW